MPARKRKASGEYSQPNSTLKVQRLRPNLRKIVREYGVKNFKAGTHPQQYRQVGPTPAKRLRGPGAILGPMGELGDDVILEVALSTAGRSLINSNVLPDLNEEQLLFFLDLDVLTSLIVDVSFNINNWVPKDTGALRTALINALESSASEPDHFPVQVVLNTNGIPYASPVNMMPTSWLVHPGTHGPRFGRSGVPLNDPNAKKGWYNLLLLAGRNRAKTLFQEFIRTRVAGFFAGTSRPRDAYNLARSLFTVKYK